MLFNESSARNNLLSSFWKATVPFKVKIIIWIVMLNKINSNDLLQIRRPHKTVPPNICVLCYQNVESQSSCLNYPVAWICGRDCLELNRVLGDPKQVGCLLLVSFVGFIGEKNSIQMKVYCWCSLQVCLNGEEGEYFQDWLLFEPIVMALWETINWVEVIFLGCFHECLLNIISLLSIRLFSLLMGGFMQRGFQGYFLS